MRANKKVMLAAGLIAGAAALAGCTANTRPAASPTPKTDRQATAQPATAAPTAQTSPEATSEAETGEETPAPLTIRLDGEAIGADAVMEGEELLLPLVKTAEALGWKAAEEETKEEDAARRVVTLDQGDSRITVSYSVSDNTIRSVSWQKDGLLIPVDAKLTTIAENVYVPAAFFEEAMGVGVSRAGGGVSIRSAAPEETPETDAQEAG